MRVTAGINLFPQLVATPVHSQIAVLLGDLQVVCAYYQIIRVPLYWYVSVRPKAKMSLHWSLASCLLSHASFVVPC